MSNNEKVETFRDTLKICIKATWTAMTTRTTNQCISIRRPSTLVPLQIETISQWTKILRSRKMPMSQTTAFTKQTFSKIMIISKTPTTKKILNSNFRVGLKIPGVTEKMHPKAMMKSIMILRMIWMKKRMNNMTTLHKVIGVEKAPLMPTMMTIFLIWLDPPVAIVL